MKKALLLIDIQNDYCRNGKMELEEIENFLENCKAILNKCRSYNIPIFHIQHISTHDGAFFFLPDTEGCNIHKSVSPKEGESIIVKNYPSSFMKTDLHEKLQKINIDELIICGAMSHMCIDTTVRAAFDLGYSSNVIYDACATRKLEFQGRVVAGADVHASFMAALEMIFAKLYNTKYFIKNLEA